NMKLYNSGGWVVDSLERQPVQGGAAILIDENLDVASLRFYNETNQGECSVVSVQAADGDQPGANPFYERLVGLVDPAKKPWSDFSSAVRSEIPKCVKNLKI